MAEPNDGILDESAFDSAGLDDGSTRVIIEDNAPSSGGSLREYLARLGSGIGGNDGGSERDEGDPNGDRGAAPKRRGRPKGSTNTRSITAKNAVKTGLKGNIGAVVKTIGHSMARMYAPYGDFWEYDDEEVELISALGNNIAKEAIGDVDNLGLKASIGALVVVVGVGFVVRGIQTRVLMARLAEMQKAQQISYQGNRNGTPPEPDTQAPVSLEEYADLMSQRMAQDEQF